MNPTKRNMRQVSMGLAFDMLNPEARKIGFDVLPKLRPTVAYGLDDYHQTHLLWDATGRETFMLFRKWYGKYENEWWHWTPQTWINHFTQLDNNVKQFGKDYSRDLVHLFLNEPKDITNRSEDYIDFVLAVLRWGKNNGFRFAFPIPNAEVEWSPLMIEGKFDRLLKAYDDEGFRQHGHIGFIHEYTMFHINEGMAASRQRAGWDAMWPDAFLYPEMMTPENWATKEEVEALWYSNYTGGRGMRVNHRMMDTLQRDPIPLVSSEGIWDKTPHLEAWKDPRTGKIRNIYREVVDHYGVKPPSPHMDFAGAASLEPLYRKMLKHVDWTKPRAFAKAVIDQPRHLHKVLPDYYIGIVWFQIDPGDPLWDINGGYSAHRIPGVWDEMYDWQKELLAEPIPEPEPEPVSQKAVALVSSANTPPRAIRVKPGTNHPQVGLLYNGEFVLLHGEASDETGTKWFHITRLAHDTTPVTAGYVSSVNGVVTVRIIDDVNVPPGMVLVTQADIDALRADRQALAGLTQKVEVAEARAVELQSVIKAAPQAIITALTEEVRHWVNNKITPANILADNLVGELDQLGQKEN